MLKKIELAKWSIQVFKSNSILLEQPNDSQFHKPSLQAADISDIPAEFVADPFILFHNSKYFMFFEVFNNKSERGEIGLATSSDGEEWSYQKIVLCEKYHLSYPYVLKVKEQFFMIPESKEANGIFLYKATSFPYEWEKVGELIMGNYVDPSLFYFGKKWWLFAASTDSNLHLFYSNNIDGKWTEHPSSPIISNNKNITRPAGRVFVNYDEIYRYAQDGSSYYGKLVRAFKITKLSATEYQEEEVNTILVGSNKQSDWRKDGMHHIDQLKINDHELMIAVDGHIFQHHNYLKWKFERFLRNPSRSINRFLHRIF